MMSAVSQECRFSPVAESQCLFHGQLGLDSVPLCFARSARPVFILSREGTGASLFSPDRVFSLLPDALRLFGLEALT